MQYSPKLKNAMAEILLILKKYDIGAFVALHTPGHTEFINRIDPSYSCARYENNSIRFLATTEAYGSEEKRNEAIENTVNMFQHFEDILGMHILIYRSILEKLDPIIIKNDPGSLSGHEEQNN